MNGEPNNNVSFFTRPFGAMFGSTGGLFGPAGFTAVRSLLLCRSQPSAFESSRVLVEELSGDCEETFQGKESRYHQHMVEHPEDVVSSIIQADNDILQEDASFDNLQIHETVNGFSFVNSIAGHSGSENLYCSLPSPLGRQVPTVIKKRNVSCVESNFSAGFSEPPMKQLRS